MKQLFILTFHIFVSTSVFGQVKERVTLTSEVIEKIKADVDKEALKFRQKLLKEGDNTTEGIEYSVDTFKLQRIADKRIDIDFSTMGMNITVDEMTDGYDKLMNRYYNKLMQILDSTDKRF